MTKHSVYKDCQRLLESGAVGVLPTDTVYGLVCRAADESAVKRLYALKSRDQKPGTVIAASIDQLIELGFKSRYVNAYKDFWPNPLSIVVPTPGSYLSQGLGSMALRVIKGPESLLALLNEIGPLLTSSANMPGQPPANNIEEARQYFGDAVDFYVDGGDFSDREPSTVIRVIDDAIEVLRPGAITISESGRISQRAD